MTDETGWTKKTRGNAKIYTHPDAFECHAVVVNHYGITFNGEPYKTLEDAMQAALSKAGA